MMKKLIIALACVLLACLTSVQASTYTNFPASVGTGGGLPAIYAGGMYVLKSSWDTRGSGYMQQGALANGNTIQMIYIPAGTVVLGVGLYVNNGATAASAATLSVGDSAGAAYWLAATNVCTTGNATWSLMTTGANDGTNYAVVATANSAGKLYTAADYILVTVAGAPTNLMFTVKAVATPLGP